MNVVLFNPRAQTSHRRLPLSLLFIARELPSRHPWVLVDGNVDVDARERLARLCRGPDTALLVTVMPGPQLRQAVPWCRELKAKNPGLILIWGGYFPSIHGAACARDAGCDYVVNGPGERTAAELLDAIESGRDPLEVAGVGLWRDGAYLRGRDRAAERSSTFAEVPYHRLDMEKYAARTFLGTRTFNHHTSVGCPYFCNFCAVVNLFEGRWLPDPADHVVRVVERLVNAHGANAIEFHDNNFFAWEKRTREVAEGIAPLGVRWWGEGRIDTMLGFEGATWEALARSGLAMVFYGAESGDQEAIDRMDKGGLKVEDIRALNRVAKRHGIAPEFSFVLGNPGNPEQDIARTLALVRDIKIENPAAEIILYLYTPVPLPGMFDDAVRGGFKFPETLDEWVGPEWASYAHRRDPHTPWITGEMVGRVRDFETVLHARHPTASDLNLRGWQRRILRALAAPRYRLGFYKAPWEIRVLQRAWGYRRPEEMGF